MLGETPEHLCADRGNAARAIGHTAVAVRVRLAGGDFLILLAPDFSPDGDVEPSAQRADPDGWLMSASATNWPSASSPASRAPFGGMLLPEGDVERITDRELERVYLSSPLTSQAQPLDDPRTPAAADRSTTVGRISGRKPSG